MEKKKMLLKGKKIIVIGGASGIGAAAVRAYAREGARIASLDINDDDGQRIADEQGDYVEYFHCDISRCEEINAPFAEVIKRFDGLNVLPHVAAIQRGGPFSTPDNVLFDQLFHVNVLGTCNTNLAAMNVMKEKGGKIINFGRIGSRNHR